MSSPRAPTPPGIVVHQNDPPAIQIPEADETAQLLINSNPNESTTSQFSWQEQPRKETAGQGGRPPMWTWLLLCASLMAVSSAGVAFAMIREVPPITLAAWRLQMTSVLLVIAAAVQWTSLDAATKADTLRHSTLALIAGSGTSLAVHFGCWVASVELTSLTHSLLFVSATPVLLAIVTWLRRQPISSGELWGTALGCVGTIILATSAISEEDVTVVGDIAALMASGALIPYLLIGRKLRAWMPLFIYAAPVTLLGATELTIAALAEGSRFLHSGAGGLFGWAASLHYLPYVIYLGIVPGIIGHTGINALLKYMNPLIITLVLNVEPLVGSVMGYLLGVAPAPGIFTYLGGLLILASTGVVSLASNKREEAARGKKVATAEVEAVFVGRLDDEDEEAGVLISPQHAQQDCRLGKGDNFKTDPEFDNW